MNYLYVKVLFRWRREDGEMSERLPSYHKTWIGGGGGAPQHLWFQLKRFRFDARSQRKEKVMDRFEFPEVLDMAPFVLDADAAIQW
jgi:hypothetical protein